MSKFNLQGSAIIGAVLGAAGVYCMGMGKSLPVYYFGAFLTGWPICLTGPALIQTTVSKWFYKGRALILGVLCMTEALGTTCVSLVTAHFLNGANGYQHAMLVSSIFVLAGGLLGGLVFLRGVPEDYGWVPIGAEDMPESGVASVETSGMTASQARKYVPFWMLMGCMMLVSMAVSCMQPHLSAYAQIAGYTATQAAVVVSVWSWTKSLSKIVYGYLGDRFGLRAGLLAVDAVAIIAGIVYVSSTAYPALLIGAISAGILSGLTGTGTLAVSRMCGQKALLELALYPHAANALAQMVGPSLVALFYTGTYEGYRTTHMVAIAFMIGYFVLVFITLQKKHMVEGERAI